MKIHYKQGGPSTDSVLYPTDLSQASEEAFHHALALAVGYGARFTLLHAVGRRLTDNWPGFPSVRSKLAEWRAAGGPKWAGNARSGPRVSKVELPIRDPVAASLDFIGRHAVDMIVLATDGPQGLTRLIRPPRAETLARKSRIFTLFLPSGGRTFVNGRTGAMSLKRIVVPVDPRTDPRPAMLRAVKLAAMVNDPSLEITLLHVEEEGPARTVEVPELPYCRWNAMQRSGDVVEEIVSAAREIQADAVIMSSAWNRPNRGSDEGGVTEGVLAATPCPVAVVPIDG